MEAMTSLQGRTMDAYMCSTAKPFDSKQYVIYPLLKFDYLQSHSLENFSCLVRFVIMTPYLNLSLFRHPDL